MLPQHIKNLRSTTGSTQPGESVQNRQIRFSRTIVFETMSSHNEYAGKLRGFRHRGVWLTVNTPKDLRRAAEFMEAHPDWRPQRRSV